MSEIVKRLMENRRLHEMAYERSDAIDRCASLGKEFVEHFHKIYQSGIKDKDFNHHCQEMQSWYESVSKIVLKSNKKLISNNQLIDWFFTVGSSVEYLFHDEGEIDLYNKFMIILLAQGESKKIVEILQELLPSDK